MQEGLRRQEETLASRVPLSSTDWHNYEGHYLKFHRLDRKPGFFLKKKHIIRDLQNLAARSVPGSRGAQVFISECTLHTHTLRFVQVQVLSSRIERV